MRIILTQLLKGNHPVILICNINHTAVNSKIYKVNLREIKIGQVIKHIIIPLPIFLGFELKRSFMFRWHEIYCFFYNFGS